MQYPLSIYFVVFIEIPIFIFMRYVYNTLATICRYKYLKRVIGPKLNIQWYSFSCNDLMHCILQELVNYYEKNSLNSALPEISTVLKCAYRIIHPSTKCQEKRPWPISSKTLPPDIKANILPVTKAPVELSNEVRMFF